MDIPAKVHRQHSEGKGNKLVTSGRLRSTPQQDRLAKMSYWLTGLDVTTVVWSACKLSVMDRYPPTAWHQILIIVLIQFS